MLTAAIRDLHQTHPGQFITDVRTQHPALWENNPYILPIKDEAKGVKRIRVDNKLINQSDHNSFHFLHDYTRVVEDALRINIRPFLDRPDDNTAFYQCGEIYISDKEKSWYSQIHTELGKDVPYWIINAGCKDDYTCKMWEHAKYQGVVDALPEITFVQIGQEKDFHEDLVGDNVINLVGKTEMRQFIRLVYHAAGVITPVSFPMHLAAALESKWCYDRASKPCIVIAGSREPSVWEAYTHHQFLHNCGMLKCSGVGGCWKSRVEALDDDPEDEKNKGLCERPTKTKSGQVIPKCMDMISVDMVVDRVHMYLEDYNYYRDWILDTDGVVVEC